MKQFLLIIFGLLFLLGAASAQQDPTYYKLRHFDKNEIQKYQNQKEFQYEKVKPKKNTVSWFSQWLRNLLDFKIFDHVDGKLVVQWGKIIMYLLFILLIGLIIYFVLKLNFSLKRNDQVNTTGNEYYISKEDLENMNFDKLIQEAERNQDFRLAIRLHFLYLLRTLSGKQLIEWRMDKPNRQYVYELSGQNFVPEFRESISSFEKFWYGRFFIDKNSYQDEAAKFLKLQNNIKPTR